MPSIITRNQVNNRAEWVKRIIENKATFAESSNATLDALKEEAVQENKVENILGHLRFCGTIPEEIKPDSREEKAYSKYTDSVVAEALIASGLTAVVLESRSNSADVEGVANKPSYDFVADAKAFRLTRTAKNQKDFKLSSLSDWRVGKKYGFIVAPSYHLPVSRSQLYTQISTNKVSILTFTHLAALVAYEQHYPGQSAALLETILDVPSELNVSNQALPYWQGTNQVMTSDQRLKEIWIEEKEATAESLIELKQEGLAFLSRERSRIMRLSHQEALNALIDFNRLGVKEQMIRDFKMTGVVLDSLDEEPDLSTP